MLELLDDEVVIYSANGRCAMPPDLTKTANGELLSASREATDHMAGDGVIVYRRSGDGGRTWGTRQIIREPEDPPLDMAYWKITLSYGEHEARSHIDWADETLKVLRGLADDAEA